MPERFSHRWKNRATLLNAMPGDAKDWLFDHSSLTARLQKKCPGKFRVELISQSIAAPLLDEKLALGIKQSHALIRQVYLYCGEAPVVFARTIIPITTLTGPQRVYANLGTRPLGAMLFADKTMYRLELEVSHLLPGEKLYEFTGVEDEPVWGRRSVFYVSEKPLLVSEYFLPALFE